MDIVFNKLCKKFFVLILAVMLLFVGCSSEVEDVIEEESKIDTSIEASIKCITTEVFAKTENSEDAPLQLIFNEFKKIYPNATIKADIVAEEDFVTAVSDALKSEEGLDFIIGTPFELSLIAKDNNLADLSSIFRTNKDAEASTAEGSSKQPLGENILSAASLTASDKKDFYPIAVSANLMAFNKKIVEDAGLLDKLPSGDDRGWSFDDYKEFILALDEKLPSTIDTGIIYYGTNLVSGTKRLITNAYGAEFSKGDEIKINSEQGIKALSGIKDIIDKQAMVNGFTTDVNENLERFIAGETAHTIYYNMGIDLSHKDKKKDNFEVVFVPYPSESGAKLDFDTIGAAVFENADEDKLELTKAFLKFLADDEAITSYVVGNMGMYSPYDEYNDFLHDEYAYLRKTISMMDNFEIADNKFDSDFTLALRKIMFLDEDVEEGLNDFAKNAASQSSDKNDEDSEEATEE